MKPILSVFPGLFVGGAFVVAALAPSTAGAQAPSSDEAVAVLGIQSQDGDDQLAARLTQALRAAVQDVRSWTLAPAEVSLAQMMVFNHCTGVSSPCLRRIATTISAERLLFGELRRNATRGGHDVALSLYEREENRMVRRISDTLPVATLEGDDLATTATRYVRTLAGLDDAAVLRVSGADPAWEGAGVLVDGRPIGEVTGGHAAFPLPAGRHHVIVVQRSGARVGDTVDLLPGQSVWFAADAGSASHPPRAAGAVSTNEPSPGAVSTHTPETLEEQTPGDGGVPSWIPWTLAGVSVAAAVTTFILWLEMDAIGTTNWLFFIPIDVVEDDPQVVTYRTTPNNNFPGVDFCTAAERERTLLTVDATQRALAAHVDDACGRADTLQILSALTLTLAVTAGATAIVLAVDPFGPDDGTSQLTLRPYFHSDALRAFQGGAEATLQF